MEKKKKNKSYLPKDDKIINISTSQTQKNLTIKSGNYFELDYYVNKDTFFDEKSYIKFIKAVENIVRTSDEYTEYKANLMTYYGLDKCAILGNIQSKDDSGSRRDSLIEMHHGPIFTLFDVCDIILSTLIKQDKNITTFLLARRVLEEHFLNNIQVVMLSQTVHELVHKGKIFIHPNQAFGNIEAFMNRYNLGITDEHKEKYNELMELAEEGCANDNGLLAFNGLKDWSNNVNSLLIH